MKSENHWLKTTFPAFPNQLTLVKLHLIPNTFPTSIPPLGSIPHCLRSKLETLCFHSILCVLLSEDITLHYIFLLIYLSPSVQFSSVQFSLSVVFNSLWPHEPQHTKPPCPSPTPRVYPNSCPSSWWCHPTISSSIVPFSSCPQSFPASGSFQMSHLSATGGQSIGVSASTSVLPMNTQDWSPLGWTGWISLQSKGLSRVFSNTTVQKHQFFGA